MTGDGREQRDDLGGRTVTLTHDRGHDVSSLTRLYAMGAAGLVFLGLLAGWWVSAIGLMGLAALLVMRREKTTVRIAAHAVTVTQHGFGTHTVSVDYATIRHVELTTGLGGRPLLVVHHGQDEQSVIAHGTRADHAALLEEIVARRPEGPAQTDLAAPRDLEALRRPTPSDVTEPT